MTVDTGSVAFMLLSTALVQLMTPGVAFFYGGLVSDKSVLTMMMQSFVAMGVISILWFFVGFSLCFGSDLYIIGDPRSYPLLMNVNSSTELITDKLNFANVPGMVIVVYQLMFAIITPTLMTGGFSERLRFKPYVIFISVWFFIVYVPFCHMAWGGGAMAQWGVWDFAGGTVVHITAGWSALGSLAVVGRRPEEERREEKPHNIPFVVLGAALIWFGWFGFNGGSALSLATPSSAVGAYINSQLAAATALYAWVLLDWVVKGKPTLVGACIGSVAGLVTITPCAGYVQPWAAVVLGAIVAVVCFSVIELRQRVLFRFLDDALDVWGCHGVGGFVGAILVGALADGPECNPGAPSGIAIPGYCINPNTVSRSWAQLGKQAAAACITAGYCMIVTPIILKVISFFMVLKPQSPDVDDFEHGEAAYSMSPLTAYPSSTRPTREITFTKVLPVATEDSTRAGWPEE